MTTQLKYESIQVGQQVKAYDWEPCDGRDDAYLEGEVVAHGISDVEGWKALVVKVSRDALHEGEFSRVGQLVKVPMEMLFDDRWSVERVQVVAAPMLDAATAARVRSAIAAKVEAGMDVEEAVELVLGRAA